MLEAEPEVLAGELRVEELFGEPAEVDVAFYAMLALGSVEMSWLILTFGAYDELLAETVTSEVLVLVNVTIVVL